MINERSERESTKKSTLKPQAISKAGPKYGIQGHPKHYQPAFKIL